MDWIDLLTAEILTESFPAPQFESFGSSELGFLNGLPFTSVYDHWENDNFVHTCVGKVMSLLFNMLCRFLVS